jgi:hypothetical protein
VGFVRNLAVRQYRRELAQYSEMLSEQSQDIVAIFIVHSVWLRSILQLDGHLNPLSQVPGEHPDIDIEPELHAYPLMLGELENIIEVLNKQGAKSKTAALAIWVHTLRGIIRPELGAEVQNLWRVILSSRHLWKEKLEHNYQEDIRIGIEPEFVAMTLELSESILETLPPKELN